MVFASWLTLLRCTVWADPLYVLLIIVLVQRTDLTSASTAVPGRGIIGEVVVAVVYSVL